MTKSLRDTMKRVARDAGIRLIKHDPSRRREICEEIRELNRQGHTVWIYFPGPDEAGSEEEDKV